MSNDDRAEGCLDFVTPIKDGRECRSPLFPQSMPYINGFLVSRLPPNCPALNECASERPRQCSSDPQCSSPHSCIPLIHATHHAAPPAIRATPCP
jgi:hypothetical protein